MGPRTEALDDIIEHRRQEQGRDEEEQEIGVAFLQRRYQYTSEQSIYNSLFFCAFSLFSYNNLGAFAFEALPKWLCLLCPCCCPVGLVFESYGR